MLFLQENRKNFHISTSLPRVQMYKTRNFISGGSGIVGMCHQYMGSLVSQFTEPQLFSCFQRKKTAWTKIITYDWECL